jgi:hypothetical protein
MFKRSIIPKFSTSQFLVSGATKTHLYEYLTTIMILIINNIHIRIYFSIDLEFPFHYGVHFKTPHIHS